MKLTSEVTARLTFTGEERDVIRRSAYADGVESYIDDHSDVAFGALVRGRGKALQGKTGHGQGNAYSWYELQAMADAAEHAIECGVCTEEEYNGVWGDTAGALDAAASRVKQDSELVSRSALDFNKKHNPRWD